METTRKEQVEIKTVPLIQKVIDNIQYLDNILTFWENITLKLMIMEKEPLTIKEIRDRQVIRLARHFKHRGETGIMIEKHSKELIYDTFSFGEKIVTPEDKRNFIKEYDEGFKKGLPTYQFVNLIEKSMRKNLGVRIPSYKKIKSILVLLQNMGIVSIRHDHTIKKGDVLWFVSPFFVKIYPKYCPQ
jgi:hypothetical protein